LSTVNQEERFPLGKEGRGTVPGGGGKVQGTSKEKDTKREERGSPRKQKKGTKKCWAINHRIVSRALSKERKREDEKVIPGIALEWGKNGGRETSIGQKVDRSPLSNARFQSGEKGPQKRSTMRGRHQGEVRLRRVRGGLQNGAILAASLGDAALR